MDVAELSAWVGRLSPRLLQPFGEDTAERVFGSDGPGSLLLFVAAEGEQFEEVTAVVRAVAREHRGEVRGEEREIFNGVRNFRHVLIVLRSRKGNNRSRWDLFRLYYREGAAVIFDGGMIVSIRPGSSFHSERNVVTLGMNGLWG